MNKNYMNIIKEVSRIILGLIFIYSGFVKAVDPLGSTYKFLDYFHDAFGLGTSLDWSAFSLAILMSAAEFVIGLNFLFGIKMKITSWAAIIFMLIFTPVTLYLAVANPVHDCGCFGDALILTNWQTFYKNIFIDVLLVIVFIKRKSFKPLLTCRFEWVFIALAFILSLFISFYGYKHLPIFDFRPYKVGTDLEHSILLPEDAQPSEYETILLYTNKETGEQKEFTMENLPDDNWEWDSTINNLLVQGYEPPIHDFMISGAEGDITDIILSDPNYQFFFVAYDLKTTDIDAFVQANEIARFCKAYGYNFRCLTASNDSDIDEFKIELEGMVSDPPQPEEPAEPEVEIILVYEREGEVLELSEFDAEPDTSWTLMQIDSLIIEAPIEPKIAFDFFFMDAIQLKTMVRANPGLVLIRDGVIIGKWHYNDMPEVKEITEEHFMANAFEDYLNGRGNLANRILMLMLFGLLLIYVVLLQFLRRQKE